MEKPTSTTLKQAFDMSQMQKDKENAEAQLK